MPGGMSTTSTSSSSHTTSRNSWFSADTTIGPRQTTGAPSSIREPIDITLTLKLSGGMSCLPSGARPVWIDSKQLGHGRPEQVGVENADREPELCEADGEIACDGGVAHAALAGGDSDDVLDAGQRFARPPVSARRIALGAMRRRSASDGARRPRP